MICAERITRDVALCSQDDRVDLAAILMCCHDTAAVAAVLRIMTKQCIRSVPVVDGESRLMEVITIDDLARSLNPEPAYS